MLENFKWGDQDIETQNYCINEIFETKTYSKIFNVEEGDIVVDLGGSNGIFSYSILEHKPSFIYVLEAISEQVKLIDENLSNYPHLTIHGALSEKKIIKQIAWGSYIDYNVPTFSFEELINEFNVPKIDFLKIDVEGGEYDIFKTEYIDYLLSIPKIVCEFHLHRNSESRNCQFRYFRDNILPLFPNYHVFSLDAVDIKWDIWNEHFLEYYDEVIFHFDNRK
jgi:FkbM family methyltransferase